MNQIGPEIVFLYFWREKISKIILDFDPSNLSRQVEYCCLLNISRFKNLR